MVKVFGGWMDGLLDRRVLRLGTAAIRASGPRSRPDRGRAPSTPAPSSVKRAAGTVPRPVNADWAWRPDPWSTEVDLPDPVQNGCALGLAIRIFHDDAGADEGDYYPEELREEIDAVNADVYDHVNNGVYRAGFATSQEAYEEAHDALFECLDALEARRPIRPRREALRVSQDRLVEKEFLAGLGLLTAPHADIPDAAALDGALRDIGTPAILKTRRFGYDGKGQVRIAHPDKAAAALAAGRADTQRARLRGRHGCGAFCDAGRAHRERDRPARAQFRPLDPAGLHCRPVRAAYPRDYRLAAG